MTEKRLVAVIIWKQGAAPDAAYTRQVLRVAAPEALGPPGADGEPALRVPVRMLGGPSEWPDDFWIVALQALRYPTDYSDPARYDLSGWQGTDSRTGSRLFVASVYARPMAVEPPAPPAFAPRPPVAPPPRPSPPAPTGGAAAPGGTGSGYGAAPGYGPTASGPGHAPGYGPPTYGPPAAPAPGWGAAAIPGPPPGQAPYPPGSYPGTPPSDAYPGHTGIPSDAVDDPNLGFYAGFGPRLLAGIIDAVIGAVLLLIPLLCTAIFASTLPTSDSTDSRGTGLLVACCFAGLSVLLLVLYHGGFWVWRGQTPGKMLAGVKVVGADGRPPGVGQMLLRIVGYLMSFALLGLGFLLIAFDERKQGLADRIAGTYVVPVKPPTRERPPVLPGYPPGPAPPADANPPPALASPAVVPVVMPAPQASSPERPRDSAGPGSPATVMYPTGVQWGPPPGAGPGGLPPPEAARAPVVAPPETGTAPPSAASSEANPAASEAFRQGLDRLAEGVREPGGSRTLLIVEPEAGQAATRAFAAAVAAAPQMAVYRYFLGVARRYGEGYGAAQPEFVQATQLDPNLWEARLQAYFGARWHDAFAYPQWSPRAGGLSPILQALRPPRPGTRLVIVREGGAKTVAALSMTARSAWHRLPTAEMPARIELVPARSPYGTAIAFYLALRDDPTDPYRGETFLNPAEALSEDGDATQLGQNLLLQLARQGHTYLIFVDEDGAVLLNRRLVFDAATQANLAQVAAEVQTLAGGPPLPTDRFTQAAQWHMDQYPLDRVAI